MGTSSSYRGPTGSNPLLPPWADEPSAIPGVEAEAGPQTPLEQPGDADDAGPPRSGAETPASDDAGTSGTAAAEAMALPIARPWRGAKMAMGRVARAGVRNDGQIRTLGRRFVGSLGGSRQAATSSAAGRATARRLGGFLAGVARDGVARTFERLGLARYIGQPLPALLVALGRVLAPAGETTDDTLAATALHETMAALAEDLGIAENGAEAFSQVDEATARATMERYVANLVVARLLHVLSSELESGAVSAERAVDVEFEIRDFVESAVALKMGREQLTQLDWDSPRAKAVTDDLVRQGYEIFGGSG